LAKCFSVYIVGTLIDEWMIVTKGGHIVDLITVNIND